MFIDIKIVRKMANVFFIVELLGLNVKIKKSSAKMGFGNGENEKTTYTKSIREEKLLDCRF
jgi:hypothetical protein